MVCSESQLLVLRSVYIYSVSRAPSSASGPEEERRAGETGKPCIYCILLHAYSFPCLSSRILSKLWPEAMASASSLSAPCLGCDRDLRIGRGERPAQQTEQHCPKAASHSWWSNNTSWFLSILCVLCDVNGSFPASCLWMPECLVMMISGLHNSVHVCYAAERFYTAFWLSLSLQNKYFILKLKLKSYPVNK